jgi:hypothetical protein
MQREGDGEKERKSIEEYRALLDQVTTKVHACDNLPSHIAS